MTEENKTTDAPVPGSPDYPLHSELTIGAYLKQQVAIDPDHEFVVYPDRDLRWTLQGLRRAHRCFGQGPPGHRHEAGRSFGRVGAQHPRLAHLHVRLREDRRGHGHGEPGVQVPRARLRAEAVGHEGALRDRCLPRCGLPADHPRSGARVAERAARLPPFRGVPLPREPHLHGAREAPRLLQRAGTSAARPAQAGQLPGMGPGPVRQQRRGHDAVHERHHGLPQGRHAHPSQHSEQRLLHRRGTEARCRRPRVPAGAVLPLLRLRAGGHGLPHPPLHHAHRGGVQRRAGASGPRQGEGDGGLRRAHHVHRRAEPPGLRLFRPVASAHGHHGRQPLPAGDHARGHGAHEHAGRDHLLRPHRDEPGVHPDLRGRRHPPQVRDRGPGPSAGGSARARCERRPHLRAGGARGAVLQGLQRHEGLLQDARGDGQGHRRRTAFCIPATWAPWTRTAISASRAASRT